MGLFDILKMLQQSPMSYGNVSNKAYEEQPQQSGGWGFGTSGAFRQPQRQQPDLAALVEQQRQRQAMEQAISAIPQQTGPVQQQVSPLGDGPMTDEMLQRALDGVSRGRQRVRPSYDYGAVESFAQPAYSEGPNTNIQDDSRARAMAWLASQNQ